MRSPNPPIWLILLAAPFGTLAATALISFGVQAIAPDKQLTGNTWRNITVASLLTTVSAGGIYSIYRGLNSRIVPTDHYEKLIQQVTEEVLSDSEAAIAQQRQSYLGSASAPLSALVTEAALAPQNPPVTPPVSSVKENPHARSSGFTGSALSNGAVSAPQSIATPPDIWFDEVEASDRADSGDGDADDFLSEYLHSPSH